MEVSQEDVAALQELLDVSYDGMDLGFWTGRELEARIISLKQRIEAHLAKEPNRPDA